MRYFCLLSPWLVPGFTSGELPAERVDDWNLHLPHTFRPPKRLSGKDGRPGEYVQKKRTCALFNLRVDAGERDNVAGEHPDVVARLLQHVERAPDDLETHCVSVFPPCSDRKVSVRLDLALPVPA